MRLPSPVLIVVAVVFSGAIQAAVSAPLSWIWLHPIAFVPAFWAFDRLEGRNALLAGWLYGVAAQATIFSWVIHTVSTFSNLPWPVAVLILGLFAAVFGFYGAIFGWGFAHVKRLSGAYWPLGIAAWFVACEFLNLQLFPYFQGVAWYQVPDIFLITAVTGVAGISFLIFLANAVLYGVLDWRLRGAPLAPARGGAIVLALGVLVSIGYSQVRLGAIAAAEESAPEVVLGMVQTNQDVFARRDMASRRKTAIADDHVVAMNSAYAAHPNVQAFVMPEGALQGRPNWPRNFRVRRFVRDTGVEVWTGGASSKKGPDGRRQWFNSAFRIHGSGEEDVRYDKNVLLPFGEYMPFASVLPFLKKIQGVGNYQPGDGIRIYEAVGQVRFAYLICYEAILSRYVRRAVNQGANLLVNITYDAWFGDTACPHQHFMLSALQAAQYGVPLVRSATTGISAFVDARGVITDTTEIFTRDVLVRPVKLVRMPGIYARLGDWFAWGCVLLCVLLLLRAERRNTAPRTWRSRWPLGIFLFAAAANAAVVTFGLGPMG